MPNSGARRDANRAAIQPVLALLAERWPHCFMLNRRPKPLAVGIRAEIERQLPEIDPRLLQRALSFYVRSMAYQRASMIPGTVRVALDGSASGTVTAEQAKKAILSVAALAERQGSRLAAKESNPETVALKPTDPSQDNAAPAPKSTGPGIVINKMPRLGLGDLREAGRRRAAAGVAKS
jgi:ProP effector